MTKKQSYKNNVITPVGRLSYPYLVDKLSTTLDGRLVEKWCVDLLFDKNADLSALKTIYKDLVADKFGAQTKNVRSPFKDGDDNLNKEGEIKPGYAGTIYLSLDTKTQAPVLKHATGELMTPEEGRNELYGGCYGRALTNAGTYDHLGNKGVKFYLVAVQKHRDGEPMGDGKTTTSQVDQLMQAFDAQEDTTDNSDLLS